MSPRRRRSIHGRRIVDALAAFERTLIRDQGKFRVPTLRNIALTAPDMHDGSIATLAGVVDHYAAGGRNIVDGPHAGDGRDNPNKSPLVRPIDLGEQDRADLVAFLESLTDERFVTDPRFAAP